MSSSSRPIVTPPRPRSQSKQSLAVVGLDHRFLPGGADRDVHDVRRAAAAPQDRHRQRRPERGLLPLCPAIRGGIAKGRPVRRGARDGGLGGEPAPAGAGRTRACRSPSFRAAWPAPRSVSDFHALGSLYREPLWVFYRGDKPLERLSQLAGKRIGVGPAGSGTHAIAMQLLAANGLIESRANPNPPGRTRGPCWSRRTSPPLPRPCRRETWMPRSSSPPSRPITSRAC